MAKALEVTVPIRMSRSSRHALRRIARRRDVNVSQLVRDVLDEYIAASVGSTPVDESSADDSVGVAA